MKSTFIATAVLAFAALGSVNAFAATYQNGEAAAAASFAPVSIASTVNRTDVKTDYLSARKAGTLSVSNEGAFAPVAQTASTVSRAQIRIEAVMAARDIADHAL